MSHRRPPNRADRELRHRVGAQFRRRPPDAIIHQHLATLRRESALLAARARWRLAARSTAAAVLVAGGLALTVTLWPEEDRVVTTHKPVAPSPIQASTENDRTTTTSTGPYGSRQPMVTASTTFASSPAPAPSEPGPSQAVPITIDSHEPTSSTRAPAAPAISPTSHSPTTEPAVDPTTRSQPSTTSTTVTILGLSTTVPQPVASATCDGRPATLVGTEKNDVLIGTEGPDIIVGGSGDDIIHGLGGDDTICGENGKDELHGGDGDDMLLGGNGTDALFGGPGVDDLDGGNGPDEIFPDGP
jgi:Ca2+-binding RTX toxin-like protein